ncbi:uncharacterized protein LOC124497136 [Dermatophagoides farinae]|uniref:uncharacterized protein LOC124497136 n=1 Tax=Dermatophagoides farinae TaxID=6954 RepID=UPI003F62CB2F
MHSRKKTSVKDEAKEKAKLLKAQKFHQELTNQLIKKSTCKDLNSLEPLARLLQINPEFGTLFNYRKEILLNFKQSIESSDEENPESAEESWKKFDKLCQTELMFTENCLQSSPKSYTTWHHRIWLIQQMRNPDLEKEIELCNKCLSLDERNFHCWDYRRFIVKFGKISTMDEFKFTSKKIVDNFSNFSSWHYRSSLYRQLLAENYDHQELQSMVNKDFDLVHNAIFTDPNDQSPWLYLRWLIDFEQHLLSLNNDGDSNGSFEHHFQINQFIWSRNYHLFAIEFNKSFSQFPLEIHINGQRIDDFIDSCESKFNGTTWLGQFVESTTLLESNQIEIEFFHNGNMILQRTFDGITDQHCFVYNHDDDDDFAAAKRKQRIDLVQKRIKDLKILLEIEADSKWPNYMLTIVLDNNDNNNLETNYRNNTTAIDKLICIDPLRSNYYKDLKKMTTLKMKLFSKDLDQKIIDQILNPK